MFTEVEEILDFLQYKMSIEEVTNEPMMTAVKGVLAAPLERTIREIKEYFSQTEYTPLFDIEDEKHIVRFGIFKKVEDKPKYWLNIILFIATIGSTIFAGYLNSGSLSGGVVFSFSIMAILTCHELGHYFVSRNAGMITTLPYFIPIPFHFIGTFGAIIRMKSIVPSRSSLLRVGMAGPLAGFIVALPITIIGIALSKVTVVPQGGGFLQSSHAAECYSITSSDGFRRVVGASCDIDESYSCGAARRRSYRVQPFFKETSIYVHSYRCNSRCTGVFMVRLVYLGNTGVFLRPTRSDNPGCNHTVE